MFFRISTSVKLDATAKPRNENTSNIAGFVDSETRSDHKISWHHIENFSPFEIILEVK